MPAGLLAYNKDKHGALALYIVEYVVQALASNQKYGNYLAFI